MLADCGDRARTCNHKYENIAYENIVSDFVEPSYQTAPTHQTNIAQFLSAVDKALVGVEQAAEQVVTLFLDLRRPSRIYHLLHIVPKLVVRSIEPAHGRCPPLQEPVWEEDLEEEVAGDYVQCVLEV